VNLWYPEAVRHDGHPEKVYAGENLCLGAILHSMEGWMASALRNLERIERRASWPFSIDLQGAVYQHYPLNAPTWHAGNTKGNRETVGIEFEGIRDQFNDAQVSSAIRLLSWISDQCGWGGFDGRLFEHNQWYATQCPSGRVPWERIKSTSEGASPVWGDDVDIRPLDQAESIAALNKAAAVHGKAINDNEGFTIVEVVNGSPVPLAPGQRAYLFVTN